MSENCVEFDRVKDRRDNGVTYIVCDLARIRNTNITTVLIKVYYRICTVRYIRIDLI